jgi:hypothetical protein
VDDDVGAGAERLQHGDVPTHDPVPADQRRAPVIKLLLVRWRRLDSKFSFQRLKYKALRADYVGVMGMILTMQHTSDWPQVGCYLPQSDATRSIAFPTIPEPPCMPSALLRLELLLKAQAADIGAICDVIRNDIGLSIGMLRLAAREDDLPTRMKDLVLCLGMDLMRSWVRRRSLLCQTNPASRSALSELARHSRLVAHSAEVIARFVDGVSSEEAYCSGLLHDIGTLPDILNWTSLQEPGTTPTGLSLALAWQLPDFIVESMQPQDESQPVSLLSQVVSAAHEWVTALEQALRAGVETHPRIPWSRTITERWLPAIPPNVSDCIFANLDYQIEPWLACR